MVCVSLKQAKAVQTICQRTKEKGGTRSEEIDFLTPRSHFLPASTVLLECLYQILRDLLGGAPLDLTPLEHEGDLAILEQRDLW